MKEILKYLRQLNNYSQEEIAGIIGVSRQSYSKYENGSVIPNDEILQKLSSVYNVQADFIKANKIPSLSHNQDVYYKIKDDSSDFFAREPAAFYGTENRLALQGVFDGISIKILDSIEKIQHLGLRKGQKIKFYIEDTSDEDEKKRQKAIEAIDAILKETETCTLAPDVDPYYKEQLGEALLEKYKHIN